MIIEDWSLLDSAYMTVVTFTTVGYDEVKPLSSGGRVFTIFLMVGGVGVMLYILAVVVQRIVEGEFLISLIRGRRLRRKMTRLSDHFVLCGFGRMGIEVAQTLERENVSFIVIDRNPEAIARASEMGLLHVEGDATYDDTLLSSGVERASGLITTVGNDSDNVFITLSARGLNPNLTIVARADLEETEGKLYRAGANKVVSPYIIGGVAYGAFGGTSSSSRLL